MGRDDRRADPVARARLSAHPRSRRGAIVIMSRAVVSRVPASAPPRRRRPPKPSPSRAPPPRFLSASSQAGAILRVPLGPSPARHPRRPRPLPARATPDIAAALALARELYGDGRLDEADLLRPPPRRSRTDPIAPNRPASSAPLLKPWGRPRGRPAIRASRRGVRRRARSRPAGPSAPGAHFGRRTRSRASRPKPKATRMANPAVSTRSRWTTTRDASN